MGTPIKRKWTSCEKLLMQNETCFHGQCVSAVSNKANFTAWDPRDDSLCPVLLSSIYLIASSARDVSRAFCD